MDQIIKKHLQNIKDRWPSSIVARTEVGPFSGGVLNARSLANADCKGTGPEGAFRIGKKIVYPVDSVIEYMVKMGITPGVDGYNPPRLRNYRRRNIQ